MFRSFKLRKQHKPTIHVEYLYLCTEKNKIRHKRSRRELTRNMTKHQLKSWLFWQAWSLQVQPPGNGNGDDDVKFRWLSAQQRQVWCPNPPDLEGQGTSCLLCGTRNKVVTGFWLFHLCWTLWSKFDCARHTYPINFVTGRPRFEWVHLKKACDQAKTRKQNGNVLGCQAQSKLSWIV